MRILRRPEDRARWALRQRGFILPVALMVGLLGVLIAVPVMGLVGGAFRATGIIEDQTRHYYAAESQILSIIQDLFHGADPVPIAPYSYTPLPIDFGEVVPNVEIDLLVSEILSTVRPLDFLPGTPTLIVGFSPSGGALELASNDDTYYQVTDSGTPPRVEWTVSSQELQFPTVSFGTIRLTAASTKDLTTLEVFVYNPNDPAHTQGGYNPIPDLKDFISVANVEETFLVQLEQNDIDYLNSLDTKAVTIKIKATRSGGFKLSTDQIAFTMAGAVTNDTRKVKEMPSALLGTIASGNTASLEHDDDDYLKVNSVQSGAETVELEMTADQFTFSSVQSVSIPAVVRSTKTGVAVKLFVFNPQLHGATGYGAADLETTIPINNFDKSLNYDLKKEHLDYLNSTFPMKVKFKLTATLNTSFTLEVDQVVAIGTSDTAPAQVVQQVTAQYIDPGLRDPTFATVNGQEGYLLRLHGIHSGLMMVNWAAHTSTFGNVNLSVQVYRGIVVDGTTIVAPGRITAKPPTSNNELVAAAKSKQDPFVRTDFLTVSDGVYTIVFFNDTPDPVIAEPFAASGSKENAWVYASAYRDYLINVRVNEVGIKSVVRQIPGPTEPSIFPWSRGNISWIDHLVTIQSWEPYGIDPLVPTPTPVRENVLVARENWASGGLTGGGGWLAPWTASGPATVTSANTPWSPSFHAQLVGGGGASLTRTVDLSTKTNANLRFYARVDSFESGDSAVAQMSVDGASWQTLKTWTPADSDSVYRLVNAPIPDAVLGAQTYVRWVSNANASNDALYIDDIEIFANTE